MAELTKTKWPKARGKTDRMEEVGRRSLVAFCGIGGCRKRYKGTLAHTQGRLADHRREKHPDWKPKRRKKGKVPSSVAMRSPPK